jgi:hypothetical protein
VYKWCIKDSNEARCTALTYDVLKIDLALAVG